MTNPTTPIGELFEIALREGRQSSAPRGGKRPGAGRKPLTNGRLTKSYALTQEHVDLLERYRLARGLKSASDALRLMIEQTLSY